MDMACAVPHNEAQESAAPPTVTPNRLPAMNRHVKDSTRATARAGLASANVQDAGGGQRHAFVRLRPNWLGVGLRLRVGWRFGLDRVALGGATRFRLRSGLVRVAVARPAARWWHALAREPRLCHSLYHSYH